MSEIGLKFALPLFWDKSLVQVLQDVVMRLNWMLNLMKMMQLL